MTTLAITVGPDFTIPAAARLMNTHRISRLPVVDDKGGLIGIVSRRDLLSVFLRPDEDIKADIRQVLDEILAAGTWLRVRRTADRGCPLPVSHSSERARDGSLPKQKSRTQ